MVLQLEHSKRCIVKELTYLFENWPKDQRYYWETEYRLGDVIPDHVSKFGKFLLWKDGFSTVRQTGKPCLWNNAVLELLTVWGSWIQAGEVMTKTADTIYVRHLSETLDAIYLKRIPTPETETASSVNVDFYVDSIRDELNKNDLPVSVHRPKIRQADWDKYYLGLTDLGKLED